MGSKQNQFKVTASAPAKIHLLGEHSVVYGKPALLSTINLRIFVTVKGIDPKSEVRKKLRIQTIVEKILKKQLKKDIPPYELEIKSDIPIGAGLGSSAAISSALITTLLSLVKHELDLNLVNDLTYQAEKVLHGNPSGGDNTTVVHGGMLWYRKETDDIKLFYPIPYKAHPNIKNFFLINSGKPSESTKQMIEIVATKFTQTPTKINKILDDQEALTKKLLSALKNGEESKVIAIIKNAQQNLERMGVVGKKAKKIIKAVEKSGGAAKICGAGGVKDGSGMILVYLKKERTITNFLKNYHLPYYKVSFEKEGVKIENE